MAHKNLITDRRIQEIIYHTIDRKPEKCEVMNKVKYKTYEAALETKEFAERKENKKLYIYKCPECNYWHLTKQERKCSKSNQQLTESQPEKTAPLESASLPKNSPHKSKLSLWKWLISSAGLYLRTLKRRLKRKTYQNTTQQNLTK